MPLFKPKTLPATSYDYHAPAGATAHGWACTNFDCGRSEREIVRRWPTQCSQCGSPADPLFDQPWDHDARGIELQWLIRNHPDRGGGFHQDQWQVWQVKDAFVQGDHTRAVKARSDARAYTIERMRQNSWWGPGDIFFHLVWYDLDHRNLEWAADDLIFWLGVSSAEDIENNNTNRTNSRQVVEMTGKFFVAGGSSQPTASEVRGACLKIGESAFQILNRDQQAIVVQLSRA